MRVACSLIVSISLLFPGAALPLTQTTQDKNAKQTSQEPQPVVPVVKQPLAFGLEDATPVKLRINRNISSADALEVPLYQLFYEGENPPKVPDLLKGKSSNEIAWGSVGKDARYLRKLRQALAKSNEEDRKIILFMAHKMALR